MCKKPHHKLIKGRKSLRKDTIQETKAFQKFGENSRKSLRTLQSVPARSALLKTAYLKALLQYSCRKGDQVRQIGSLHIRSLSLLFAIAILLVPPKTLTSLKFPKNFQVDFWQIMLILTVKLSWLVALSMISTFQNVYEWEI